MKQRNLFTYTTGLLLVSAGLLLPALSVARASESPAPSPRCARPVFYAQTVNHKKAVEICLVSRGVSYAFGKTGAETKEMDKTVPVRDTTYAWQNNGVIRIQEFTVRMGEIRYQVSAGTNDDGESVASLYVYKGAPETGKLLAEIALDPATVVNNIGPSLAEEGVIQADSL